MAPLAGGQCPRESSERFLACQMPECQASRFFRLLTAMACLDNLVAGIPNAIKFREVPMSNKDAVRKILDQVKADKRTSLTAPEGKVVCDAYSIPVPKEDVANAAADAAKIATSSFGTGML